MLIADFCRTTGLSRDTVRFYVRRGLLQPQVGRSGSNRYQSFDAVQVDRALVIREAQALGLTLREIAVLGEEYARGDLGRGRKLELMRERLAVIEQQAKRLRQLKQYFVRKIEWLEAGEQGVPPTFMKQGSMKPVSRC